MFDLRLVLPEIYLALGALLILVKGLFRGQGKVRGPSIMALAVLVSTPFILWFVFQQQVAEGAIASGLFVLDPLALILKSTLLLGAFLAIMMALRATEQDGLDHFEYPVLLLFAVVGMMIMVSAHDFMTLYLGLELQNLALYVLASFRRDETRSSEAGLKYFVLGALSSGLLLYGISLLYGFGGSTDFARLATALQSTTASIGVMTGLVFVLVGLAFKVAAAPFHMWAPDVYEGAPTPVTTFFAVVPKIAALGVLTRVVMGPFSNLVFQWQQILMMLSAVSMIWGAFAALRQTNIKRLLAYSSVGHVGYALLGLAAGTQNGVRGVVLYIMIYMMMTAGAFAVVLSLRRRGKPVEQISDLSGLARTNLRMALAMLVLMFSMTGIPPAAGFFAKFFVFQAALEAGATQPFLYGLAVLGVLTSVVAAFYYLKIVKIMWADQPVEALDQKPGAALKAVLIATTLIVFPLFLVLMPSLLEATSFVAQALING